MPTKSRYWKNPAHHRAQQRNRARYLIALGVPYTYQRSLNAIQRRRKLNAKYCRSHRAENNKAKRKYRDKLRRLFGNCGLQSVWLHTQLKATQNAENRKRAASSLSRKLVESRICFHLVSRWQYHHRHKIKGWGVVLLGRNSRLQRPIRFKITSRIRSTSL